MREISSLPLRLNITTFIYEHQMKIYDLIVAGIVLMMMYEGFNSEFMNPTIFDIVKMDLLHHYDCVLYII